MRAEKLDTEIRREQIAQAALDLVAIHGVKGITNERIASMVGIVPSALYKHFKNKGQIIDAIVQLMVNRMMGVVKEAQKVGDNPLETIRRVYLAELRLILQSPGAKFILFSDEVVGGKNDRRVRFQEVGRLHFGQITALFQKALDKKQIRTDFPPETLAVFYIGLVSQAGFLLHHKGQGTDIFKHGEMAWKAFMDMLKPQ